MSSHQLRVVKIIQETPDARSFVFEVPPALTDKFIYKAGQFLTFRVPHESGDLNRCYSLSSAPETDSKHLKVTVKRVANGKGSNWFNDILKEGCSLEVLPPAGRFVLRDGNCPLLLFGGGSGITPMMSLIKSALNGGIRRIRLFYANRDRTSIIFDNELRSLVVAGAGRLEVIHHLDVAGGPTRADDVREALKSFEDAEAYLCGPGPFMDLVEQTLREAGMARSRILVERFEAARNEFVAAVPVSDDVIPTEITIHLENNAHKIPYKKGQTILEAARAAGLNPLSSCEEGFCASCAAKTIKGRVVLAKNDIYTSDDLANQWILACQALCFGREVEVTFDDIQ
jgi:3-ketosteroid 9alpha-monooxygenase subunit B